MIKLSFIQIIIYLLSIPMGIQAQWGHALHFNWWERDRAEVLDAPYIWPPQMPTGTIELWFKPDSILASNTHDPDYTYLFSKNIAGNNVGDLGAAWQRGDGRIEWFIQNGEVTSHCFSDSTLIPYFEPRWYHFACTWDVDTGMHIFIDGIKHSEMGSTEALPVESGEQIFVIGDGAIDLFNERYETFRGTIDEMRISTMVRYKDNFDLPQAPFEPDLNTLALWHFDEGQGVFAYDATGNGFNAHLGGHKEGFVKVDTVLTKPDWVKVERTGVERESKAMSFDFTLYQNYPNPFNNGTMIRYQLSQSSWVRVNVFDLMGRNLSTLIDEVQDAGTHIVSWQGMDSYGQPLPSGEYLCKLQTGDSKRVVKMVLIR